VNRLASSVSALLGLVLALVLLAGAVVAVGVLIAGRFVAGAVGAVLDGARDRIPRQR
jgi:hypothetical protein